MTSHIQSFSGPCPSEPHQKVSATEPIFIFTSHFFKMTLPDTFQNLFFVDFGWPPKARDLSPAASGGFGFWKMTPNKICCRKNCKLLFFMIFQLFGKSFFWGSFFKNQTRRRPPETSLGLLGVTQIPQKSRFWKVIGHVFLKKWEVKMKLGSVALTVWGGSRGNGPEKDCIWLVTRHRTFHDKSRKTRKYWNKKNLT